MYLQEQGQEFLSSVQNHYSRLLLACFVKSTQVTCGVCGSGAVALPEASRYGWMSKNYVICVCTAVTVSASGGLRTLDPL